MFQILQNGESCRPLGLHRRAELLRSLPRESRFFFAATHVIVTKMTTVFTLESAATLTVTSMNVGIGFIAIVRYQLDLPKMRTYSWFSFEMSIHEYLALPVRIQIMTSTDTLNAELVPLNKLQVATARSHASRLEWFK